MCYLKPPIYKYKGFTLIYFNIEEQILLVLLGKRDCTKGFVKRPAGGLFEMDNYWSNPRIVVLFKDSGERSK